MLVNGDEYLVEESLKIVPLYSVHHKTLEWGDHDEIAALYGNVQVDKPSVVQLYRKIRDSSLPSPAFTLAVGKSERVAERKNGFDLL